VKTQVGNLRLFHSSYEWQTEYPTLVRQLEKDLPQLLAFFNFPKHLWKQLRTTNIISVALWKCGDEHDRWSAL
jgi:transposase-like protein